jgi:hypothetical protein
MDGFPQGGVYVNVSAGDLVSTGMNWLGLLKGLLKGWLVFYLVTHGVSLPADGELELGELAAGLYYGGLGWLRGLLP